MIVNNVPRPNVSKFEHAKYIAQQIADIKRYDTAIIDARPKRQLEVIKAAAKLEQAYLLKKELDELKLYTAHNKRVEYYDYKRILYVGLNFDRYS